MGGKLIHVRLRPAAEGQVRAGHPWVFAESIKAQNREGRAGELVTIFDNRDRFLAIGFYDASSPIRVRVIHSGKPLKVDFDFWNARLKLARQKREEFFGPHTTGYRIVHGENDGFPGLVLDRYDSAVVCKLYTAAWFQHWTLLRNLLEQQFPIETVVLRLSNNLQSPAREIGLHDGQILHGPGISGPVTFLENNLWFEADVMRGQKTGFFLDQRENRERVEKLSRDKMVLNTFSFSGGFSLYAARGGARSVTDVDISAHALESAKRNFTLNPEATRGCEHKLIQANVFEYLKEPGEKFDLVIVDPPSLARRENERAGAVKAYETLNAGGIMRLKRGGILVAASCSAHVSPKEFFGAVRNAAVRSGREFVKLEETLHPVDHPVTFPEAQYLKCVYLKFDEGISERARPGRERKRSRPRQ